MKKRTSIEEMNAICIMLIEDFHKKFHYSNIRTVDIETFVTDYLGTKIVYEDFAVDVRGRGGYISDGERALPVLRNGMRELVIFPENVIVIESSLTDLNEQARLRFAIAHEAAHFIMHKHIPGDFTAAFYTEYTEGECYTPAMLSEMLSITETIANRSAACLLMPPFVIERALNTYNNGNKVIAFKGADSVLPDISKRIVQRMADSMGVSYSACYYRLKELNLFDVRPLEEYAANFMSLEAGNV